jgi:hypothetical protein
VFSTPERVYTLGQEALTLVKALPLSLAMLISLLRLYYAFGCLRYESINTPLCLRLNTFLIFLLTRLWSYDAILLFYLRWPWCLNSWPFVYNRLTRMAPWSFWPLAFECKFFIKATRLVINFGPSCKRGFCSALRSVWRIWLLTFILYPRPSSHHIICLRGPFYRSPRSSCFMRNVGFYLCYRAAM